MTQLGFYYDMVHCIGCKSCELACKDKNDLSVGPRYRRVYDMEGGKYPNPWLDHLSVGCNHCQNPKCVENCPAGSLYKRAEDGLVLQDVEKCIGCKLCIWSCPYEAPQYIEQEGRIRKCDFCADLIAKGENPACVDACIMRVLHYGEIEELAEKYGANSDANGIPDSSITNPSLIITPKNR